MKLLPELVLPWPDRILHPNTRTHWAKRAKATKDARAVAYFYAVAEGWNSADLPAHGPIHVWLDGYANDRRRRDADGLLSSMKAAIDGIADALGVDDRRFVPHPRIREQTVKGGEVRIRITTGDPA